MAEETPVKLRAVLLSLNQTGDELTRRMDELWHKAKEKDCPKEFMDYLMWWEHEVARIPIRLHWTASQIRRKGLDNAPEN